MIPEGRKEEAAAILLCSCFLWVWTALGFQWALCFKN